MTRVFDKATWGGRAALVALALAGNAATASAQVDPIRAFRGLFVPVTQGSTATVATDISFGTDRPAVFAADGKSDAFVGITPSISFLNVGRRSSFGLTGSGLVRRYSTDGAVRPLFQAVGAGFQRAFGRTGMQLQQSLTYHPSYEFTNLPGISAPVLGETPTFSPDRAADGYSLLSTQSMLTLGRQISRYQWLSAGYRYTYTTLRSDDPAANSGADGLYESVMHGHAISMKMTQQFGAHLGLRFGLTSSTGQPRSFGRSPNAWVHDFTIEVDRFQNIAINRSTTLNFGGGGAVLNDPHGRRFVFVGGGGIRKQFGRSLRAGAAFHRHLGYVRGLEDPVLTNGLSAVVQRQGTDRWIFSLELGASTGRAAVVTSGPGVPYRTFSTGARIGYRLVGPLGGYVDYFRFFQAFDDTGTLPVVGRPVDRNGLRVGVLFAVPLFGQRGVE